MLQCIRPPNRYYVAAGRFRDLFGAIANPTEASVAVQQSA
jgi:hypothetical protein